MQQRSVTGVGGASLSICEANAKCRLSKYQSKPGMTADATGLNALLPDMGRMSACVWPEPTGACKLEFYFLSRISLIFPSKPFGVSGFEIKSNSFSSMPFSKITSCV